MIALVTSMSCSCLIICSVLRLPRSHQFAAGLRLSGLSGRKPSPQ
jgi:hypothetical protein